ncbi:MAG: hypothetical protein NXI20_17785 [bacterium]|nr:hypothetical protein [bacterium]
MGLEVKTKFEVFLEMWEHWYKKLPVDQKAKTSKAYEKAEMIYISKIGHRAYSGLECFLSARRYHLKKEGN